MAGSETLCGCLSEVPQQAVCSGRGVEEQYQPRRLQVGDGACRRPELRSGRPIGVPRTFILCSTVGGVTSFRQTTAPLSLNCAALCSVAIPRAALHHDSNLLLPVVVPNPGLVPELSRQEFVEKRRRVQPQTTTSCPVTLGNTARDCLQSVNGAQGEQRKHECIALFSVLSLIMSRV